VSYPKLQGFLWSTLGSPRAAVRWQAAHCVRRLAELNCQREIDQIINWLTEDSIGAFGSNHYPFYHLHARQYLLIALARIAQDQPAILLNHHAKFLHLALLHEPHILIQLFSAKIALTLEQAFPGTYEPENVVKLEAIGQSPYPFRETNDSQERYNSPWHEQGRIEDANTLHFGIDLPPYWFDPLGDVFGIPVKQIEELVSDVIKIDWQLPIEEKFIRDPRASLWRSRSLRDETRHSHGSYPRTDDYSFYLGYHGMMCVAAKLLQSMPVLRQEEGWQNHEWSGWLKHHLLTRIDGRWLADRRDAMPLDRPQWVFETSSSEWNAQISNEDLLNALLCSHQGDTWLYTRGFWVEIEHRREERVHISSALVAEETADSLLNALTSCQNHHDYRLPDDGDEMEIDEPPFILSGWIKDIEISQRLDKYDPLAAGVEYPPNTVGNSIVELFKLTTDQEQREWFLPDGKVALKSEIWKDHASQEQEQSIRNGRRISASLQFLRRLCKETQQALVIEVELERDFSNSHQRRNNDDTKAGKTHKVYLLYRDGTLRDCEKSYCLREKISD
jgi:hypothetical protein